MFRGENAPETGLSRFPPVIEKIAREKQGRVTRDEGVYVASVGS